MNIPNPYIFKKYDIRGIVQTDFPHDLVVSLGKAIGSMVKQKKLHRVCIGRDCRETSEALTDYLAEGLLTTGCELIDIGMCTTPMVYFALHTMDLDAAVMITGSHNPPEYNGLKICIGDSAIFGEDIQVLKHMIEKDDFVIGNGLRVFESITKKYTTYMRESVTIARPLKIVVDAGNGTVGPVILPILEDMSCETIPLFCDVDSSFPYHHPDPSIPQNLSDLQKTVREMHADIGIAFDGDGDRIGVVDDAGQIIFPDIVLTLYAEEILTRIKGARILADVKSSQRTFDKIKECGGEPIMCKTGHSLIKAQLREVGAACAGELSGHMYFNDRFFGYDDAIYAAMRLLEIISRKTIPLSKIITELPHAVSTPEIHIACPDGKKAAVIDHIADYFSNKDFDIITIDGVRITCDEGWGLVRASNTEPVLVLRFEADNGEALKKIRLMVVGVVESILEKIV